MRFQNLKNNLLNVQDVLFEGQSHFRYYLQNDYFPFKFQSTTLRPLPLIWNYLRSVEYELICQIGIWYRFFKSKWVLRTQILKSTLQK